MDRIAKFEKVSLEQFYKDVLNKFYPETEYPRESFRYDNVENFVKEWYDFIKLPQRGTIGSAGYDFFLPMSIVIPPEGARIIPTGIRCKMDIGWVLQIVPRSSLGIKHCLAFDNTISVIDSDYSYANNEGHIFIKIRYRARTEQSLRLNAGDRIAQGIFLPYGITEDDNVTERRTGGIGSTGR